MRLRNMCLCMAGGFLLIVFTSPARASTSNIKAEIACLSSAYNDFQKASSDEEKKSAASKYLGCFPSTFAGFEQLFGFDLETRIEAPLLKEYPKYLNFLAKNYFRFNKVKFAEKFIRVATEANEHVESVDAEGELEGIAMIPMWRDPSIALNILSRYSDHDIYRFWNFTLNTLENGVDANLYSCPSEFSETRACKILAKIKSNTVKEYKPPC